MVAQAIVAQGMTAPPAVAEPAASPFTSDEAARLRAGGLVRRPARWGREVGGTSWQRIHAPVSVVWNAIANTRNFQHLLPGVSEAREIMAVDAPRGEREAVVYIRHHMSIVSASYYARTEFRPETNTVRFWLDRSLPHAVEGGRGFLKVHRYRQNESIVEWGVRADPGPGLLGGIVGRLVSDWILKVPWCVKSFVEARAHRC